jgi:ubiquinone/menaquinone biosynthesis C-methylase UbiE
LGNFEVEEVSASLNVHHPNADQREQGEGPFGRVGAISYDNDARRMARRYRSAHVIQNDLVSSTLERAAAAHPIVIDLGCGTGSDGLHILSRVHNAIYVGVDSSGEMLERAKHKLVQHDLGKRSFLLNSDFRSMTSDELFAAIRAYRLDPNIYCVMSALALHHYELSEKKIIYELARAVLKEQGLLVLTDLYSNALPYCAEQALQRELVDVRAALKRIRLAGSKRVSYPTTISERHYIEDNRPHILSEEMALVSSIGFTKVDAVFRNGQLAIIAAGREEK